MAVPQKPTFNRPPGAGGPFRPGGNKPNRGNFRGRLPQKEAEHRINHHIRVPQVRLVGDNVEVGIYSTQEALKIAQQQELDLVEISPTADPPFVRSLIIINSCTIRRRRKKK
ncbi:translation initiation factor IF-3 [Niabella hibiscisoli]|uniref:translation initiation factor IF-3 n=1 Tax=Niabella hibiscisoli TaxID=1825928 RepID=UPI001F0E9B65|nr:hypothetical protein [Niabella hibiscisoli]MCH5714768.1 hypothetical protein [Niabella hibiscisoli]